MRYLNRDSSCSVVTLYHYHFQVLLPINCFDFFVHLQDIELNKARWSALFEPYHFFGSYKNYLQVDIVAANLDDFRAWKGWVESRFRQLTLMVTSFSKLGY